MKTTKTTRRIDWPTTEEAVEFCRRMEIQEREEARLAAPCSGRNCFCRDYCLDSIMAQGAESTACQRFKYLMWLQEEEGMDEAERTSRADAAWQMLL